MKKNYIALQPLLFGVLLIAIGEKVELTDKEAQQLLEIGHIELAEEMLTELTDGEKAEAVKKAMTELADGVEANWTKSGFPNAAVLTAVVGFEVKAGLRDALWAELKAAEIKADELKAAELKTAEAALGAS